MHLRRPPVTASFFSMDIRTTELVEEILSPYSANDAVRGYRNHVYRVISFCHALYQISEEEREMVAIAACFHDLGIYTQSTFDYLPPSIDLARAYLDQNDLNEWEPEVTTMIDQHHRLRPIAGCVLAEVFRKADSIDFSLGLLKHGVPRSKVAEVRAAFPNLGFHRNLARIAGRWICRHPFRPVPVLKW